MKGYNKANRCIRLYVDISYRLVSNSVRINTHNSLEHEQGKLAVAFRYIKEGYLVYTEVRLKGGGIADVFVPELYLVIEVLTSETEKEFLKKTAKYPSGLDILYIKSGEVLK